MHWRPQQLVATYSFATRNCSYTQYNSALGSRFRKRAFTSSSTACAAETSATGANPYPFPQKSRPTPLEIFHLSPSATPKQIKHRYFELARIYHPDSAISRPHPADLTQTRWNSISSAYDHLRGKRSATSRHPWPTSYSHSSYPHAGTSSSSSAGSYAGRRTPWGGFTPDGHPRPHPDGLTEPFWLSQRTLMMAAVITVCSSLLLARALVTSPTVSAAQHHIDAVYNLEQARKLGKEQGERRRQELRAWVEEGGMKGMGSNIGKGKGKSAPPDDALDAHQTEEVLSELHGTR